VTRPSASLIVNLEPTNPGQFFACCGVLELSHHLWPGTEGWFEGEHFHLQMKGPEDVGGVIASLVDVCLNLEVEAQEVPGVDPKIAPLKLGPPLNMHLDWWLTVRRQKNYFFKTWAANATSRQMLTKWQPLLTQCADRIREEPANLLFETQWQQGSYGFDCDMGWDRLDVGFSLNEHSQHKKLPVRPATELLGAIGLQRFRPVIDRASGSARYTSWGTRLSAPVAAAAVRGTFPVPGGQTYHTAFVSRGTFKGLDQAQPMETNHHG
jgi:hypothetical protein